MKKIITILGTRPEIIKLSPLIPLLDKEFNHIIIHTGQHYSYNMDKIFFKELGLRDVDYHLDVGSDTHAKQTCRMMVEIENILMQEKPKGILVFADPNTPLAGALVASKLNIPLVHLEAGCRSFNKKMPEEINRIVVDHCSDLLLAPDGIAYNNLINEGIQKRNVRLVGSTVIDASLRNRIFSKKSTILKQLNLKKRDYILCTVHRAENTDNINVLKGLVMSFNEIAEDIVLVFPLHPRTKKLIKKSNIKISPNLKVIEPQSYFNFLKLLDNALLVMSDSGGIQEEAAALNVPCLILRNETEWTYLIKAGKNLLLGTNPNKIIQKTKSLLSNKKRIDNLRKIKVNFKKNVSREIVKVLKNEFKK